MHTLAGTQICMAPEIFEGKIKNKMSYTKKVDVWSLGILIYYLCC
jgi:serine/threonine protein kinase